MNPHRTYAADRPDRLPACYVFGWLVGRVLGLIPLTLRLFVVLALWLVVLPLYTAGAWRAVPQF